MAKTAIDVVDLMRDYLKTSPLMTYGAKPLGGLFKYQRPEGSRSEDVVINSLPVNRTQLQRGIINVNIFVPNMTSDSSLPNLKRLKELAELMEQSFLGEVWSVNGDYNFEIEADNLMPDENNQHYLNFRIEFRSKNL